MATSRNKATTIPEFASKILEHDFPCYFNSPHGCVRIPTHNCLMAAFLFAIHCDEHETSYSQMLPVHALPGARDPMKSTFSRHQPTQNPPPRSRDKSVSQRRRIRDPALAKNQRHAPAEFET